MTSTDDTDTTKLPAGASCDFAWAADLQKLAGLSEAVNAARELNALRCPPGMRDPHPVIEAMARALCSAQPLAVSPDSEVDGHPLWKEYAKDIAAVLRAAEAAGWKLVPVEPTQHMAGLGTIAVTSALPGYRSSVGDAALKAYRDMLSVSPDLTEG